MKLVRLLSTMVIFWGIFLAPAAAQNCKYTLNLYDEFGDGWTGNVLNLNLNGVDNLYTIDLPTVPQANKFATFQVDVSQGQNLKVSLKSGSFAYEISWALLDNNGDTVTAQAVNPIFPGLASGEYYSGVTTCGGCQKPQNLTVNPFAYTAKVRWSGPAATYHVVYGLASTDLLAGQGDTVTTTQLKYTLTGLFENTPYKVMVYRDCPDGSVSTVAGPIAFSTYFSDDVGVSQVVSPVSDCDLGTEQIVVLLKNYGANPQSLVKFWYSVDGQVAGIPFPDDGFYTGVLGKDSAEYIQFETLADLGGPGQHVIKVWTELQNDDNTSNDTTTYYLTNKVGLPYQQGFEDWNGAWHVDLDNSTNPSWAWGKPNKPFNLTEAATGEKCWVTGLGDTYNYQEESYLVSPCLDFSAATTDPTIRFSLWTGADSFYDGMWLDISYDNGQTWTRVGSAVTGTNPGNWYQYTNTISNLGDVWSNYTGQWVTARHKLDGAKGKQNVLLRFGVNAGMFFTQPGFAIDNINIFEQKQKDLTPLSGTTPGAGLCGLANDKLTIQVRNEGSAVASSAGNAIKLGYQVDNDAPVIETPAGFSIAANNEKSYTFTTPFNSIGFHVIKVWTAFSGDQNIQNDTTVFTINNVVKSLPLKEDFEDQQFPQDWTLGGGILVTDQHNAPSFVLAKNLFSFSGDYLAEIPAYGVIAANDTLSFDYRLVDYDFSTTTNGTVGTVLDADIEFTVQASTDCGTTWKTIYTINKANHVTSKLMKKVKISLAQFAGKVLKLQIVGLSTSADADFWFDLDNINIAGCPESFDVKVTVNEDANQGQNLASVLLQPQAGTAPFTYVWSNGGSGNTQVGLANGAYKVTVTDKNGCSDVVNVYVEVVGTNNIEGLKNYRLMPNPTNGQASVSADFDKAVDAQIEVVNMLGQVVYAATETGTAQVRHQFDLAKQTAGIYLVRLKVDGRVKISKLVLTR